MSMGQGRRAGWGCRAVPAVRTWPSTTSDTSSGRSPARRSTSRMAAAPSSCAGSGDSPPLKEPVRGGHRGLSARTPGSPAPRERPAPALPHPRRSWRPTRTRPGPRSWREAAEAAVKAAEGAERSSGKTSGAAAAAGENAEPAPGPPLGRAGRGGRTEPGLGIRRREPEDSRGPGRPWRGRTAPWGDR